MRLISWPAIWMLLAVILLGTAGCGSSGSAVTRATDAKNEKPVSVPGAYPTLGGLSLRVHCWDAGSYAPDGSIVKWEWSFDDAGEEGWLDCSESSGDTWHTYESAGTFNARLRVTDNGGKKASAGILITVDPQANASPVACLQATPDAGDCPLAVAFTTDGSYDPDGTIVKYEWDWDGDGTWDFDSGSTGTASHVYSSPGTYQAWARVTDNDGTDATASAAVDVNAAPVAQLAVEPASGTAPLDVALDASGSNDSDGTIVAYEFDFGEGAGWEDVADDPTVTHTYAAAGSFTAQVRVTDDDGAQTTDSSSILIYGADDWFMFGHDPQHTRRSAYTGPATNILKWSYTTGDIVNSSPAIGADGTVYVGSHDDKLYAFTPYGSLKWFYTTGADVSCSPAIGADGTVYVGSNDGKLYAINPNGSLKWAYTAGGWLRSSPAIGEDGTVYIGSELNGKLYAINPNGSLKWAYTTMSGYVYSSPAIGADGTVYVGASNYDKLYAINPNGSLKWAYPMWGHVYSSPAVGADGTVYVGCEGSGNLYAISPDGSLKWVYTTGGLGIYSSPAIAADGTVYVGNSGGNNLYAIKPDGTLKWKYPAGSSVTSCPAIGADGTVYVGSYKKVNAINPDGTLKWEYLTGDWVSSSPAIGADGTVYVGSMDHKLYAFGPGGG